MLTIDLLAQGSSFRRLLVLGLLLTGLGIPPRGSEAADPIKCVHYREFGNNAATDYGHHNRFCDAGIDGCSALTFQGYDIGMSACTGSDVTEEWLDCMRTQGAADGVVASGNCFTGKFSVFNRLQTDCASKSKARSSSNDEAVGAFARQSSDPDFTYCFCKGNLCNKGCVCDANCDKRGCPAPSHTPDTEGVNLKCYDEFNPFPRLDGKDAEKVLCLDMKIKDNPPVRSCGVSFDEPIFRVCGAPGGPAFLKCLQNQFPGAGPCTGPIRKEEVLDVFKQCSAASGSSARTLSTTDEKVAAKPRSSDSWGGNKYVSYCQCETDFCNTEAWVKQVRPKEPPESSTNSGNGQERQVKVSWTLGILIGGLGIAVMRLA